MNKKQYIDYLYERYKNEETVLKVLIDIINNIHIVYPFEDSKRVCFLKDIKSYITQQQLSGSPDGSPKSYSPFEDSIEYHESIGS
jgi:hypothetical protein